MTKTAAGQRQKDVIARALSMGVPVQKIADRYGRTRSTIYRAGRAPPPLLDTSGPLGYDARVHVLGPNPSGGPIDVHYSHPQSPYQHG